MRLRIFKLARIYVSTGYTVFAIGIFAAFIIFFLVHGLLNWAYILKCDLHHMGSVKYSCSLCDYTFFDTNFIKTSHINY